MRRDFKTGGRVAFKQGGAYGPLRGTTAGGVAKAFRGKEGFKESQGLEGARGMFANAQQLEKRII